ncbi:hypothetical protein [Xanthocytophaga agilis]|uniref:Lipoprotein n=1 Tax=Xanthocytophaga agilis TaxID=3048010 RepID=A0AAE3RBE6_9BACT|nr:hypothetical protein [Xanthocytophaga agilis]MDJ1504323.1 hypothetical protein [Xanthocytophaga agilis]
MKTIVTFLLYSIVMGCCSCGPKESKQEQLAVSDSTITQTKNTNKIP